MNNTHRTAGERLEVPERVKGHIRLCLYIALFMASFIVWHMEKSNLALGLPENFFPNFVNLQV